MDTVTAQKLAELVAKRLGGGTTPDDAAWVLNSAIEVIREQLSSGNEVMLGDDIVAAMLVGSPVPGAPAVQAESASDMAATEIIQLDEAAPIAALPAEAVAPAAGEVASAGLAEGQQYSILFVVPAADFFTNVIVGRLSGPKSDVSVAEGLDAARAQIEQDRPDLVILDGNVEGHQDLVHHIKSTKELSLVAVIVIFPEGAEVGKVDGLRVFEDASIVEPFEVADLVSLAETELARSIEEREWFSHEINFQFQTAEQWIEQANDEIARLIDQSGLDEEASAATCVAFREAVDNAARHGNRLQAKRLIDVIYLVDKEKVSITVEDEGDGFDTDAYLSRGREGNAVAAARARHEAGRVGGLGIMLMLRCVDDLEYNSVGNKLKVTKFIAV